MDNNVQEAVQTAQAPGTFDVLSFVEGTAYPTDQAVLFQDVKSAAEFLEIQKKIADAQDSDTVNELEAEAEALTKKISDSALIFNVRGMPPGIVSELLTPKDAENNTPEAEQQREHAVVARSITSVQNAKGEVDSRNWTPEDVTKLRKFVKEGEFGKLLAAVGKVNFNAAVFDEATDAGFSR